MSARQEKYRITSAKLNKFDGKANIDKYRVTTQNL